jgi:hypothetical protein
VASNSSVAMASLYVSTPLLVRSQANFNYGIRLELNLLWSGAHLLFDRESICCCAHLSSGCSSRAFR